MNKESLESLSIAELKALIITAESTIERKTETLRKEIQEQAIARAVEQGIDPNSIFKDSPKKTRKSSSKPKPKYRNPANSNETWVGRGSAPKWFNNHLESGGTKDEMLIV